ncbi:Glyoxylate reductase [Hordeum vulgare]|nr:Glyoxylate reductase [Hordeum vulgare]
MVVANSREVFSTDVADYAIGLLLDVLWHVSAAERYVQHGSWLVQGDHPLGSKGDKEEKKQRSSSQDRYRLG